MILLVTLAACSPEPAPAAAEPGRQRDDTGVFPEEDTGLVDEDGDGARERLDCDDTDPARHPGATELCNGVDDDCDGTVDIGAADATAWYADGDGDGYGAGAPTVACSGASADAADCDDMNPEVHPGRDETCATAYDDDCDGMINEADAGDAVAWAPDHDGDGYGDAGAGLVGCSGAGGTIADATDCDDSDDAINPGMRDLCDDAIDQDCDGSPRTCPYVGALTTDTATAEYDWADPNQPYTSAQIGDVTGDGIADLLLDYLYDSTVVVVHDLATASGDLSLPDTAYFLTMDEAPSAVSGGFDYTGDGQPDLLVGIDGDDTTFDNAGRIDLIPGPIKASGELPARCAAFYGEAEDDVLDQGFPGADFDGDGAPDLLMSAYQYGDRAGAVYIFFGPAPCVDQGVVDADVILRGETDSLFGVDTSPADLDQDGRVDLVVGAALGSGYAGDVRIYSALASGEPIPDAVWTGEGGEFGLYVDAQGDADGDGFPDLISTAATFGSGTFDQPGRVYLFYSPGLGSGAAADADAVLDGDGHTNGGGGGHWAGDINGDGYSDLLVVNPELDTEMGAGGTGFLFYGPVSGALTRNTDADAWFEGSRGACIGRPGMQPGEYALGDVDADGTDDFMLPAAYSAGPWVFHGGY